MRRCTLWIWAVSLHVRLSNSVFRSCDTGLFSKNTDVLANAISNIIVNIHDNTPDGGMRITRRRRRTIILYLRLNCKRMNIMPEIFCVLIYSVIFILKKGKKEEFTFNGNVLWCYQQCDRKDAMSIIRHFQQFITGLRNVYVRAPLWYIFHLFWMLTHNIFVWFLLIKFIQHL